MGFSGDGVYNHCGVTGKMEKKFGKKILYTWDPMHKAVLTDTVLRSGAARRNGLSRSSGS